MPDIINVSDSILRLAQRTRLFSDTTNLSDTVAQTSAREIIKTLSQTITISEALAPIQLTKQRLISQTVTISDQLQSQIVHATRNRTLSEDVSISDAVTKSTVRDIIKTLSDSIIISEGLAKQPTKQRIISPPETVNIAENLQAYKNDEPLIPPLPPALPQVPNLIGTRERGVRALRRAPRPIIIDEISNTAIAPLKLLAFSHDNNKAIVGIRPRLVKNVARVSLRTLRHSSDNKIAYSGIKTSPEAESMIVKAKLGLPLSSLYLTTAKLKLRPQLQTIHALKAVNFEKMHKLTRIMKIAMLAESL